MIDGNNSIRGVITFDNVIRAMQDLASEDIFTMVGTSKVDPFAKRITRKVMVRAPWLLTTFFGGLLSAYIMKEFQATITDFSTVLFFIPFVLGISGNVGLQGSTVIVRGLATGDIQKDNILTVVRSELIVGIVNGIIFGLLCGFIITLIAVPMLKTSPFLGLAVGLGIVLAVSVATLIGSTAQIIFLRTNINPAISSGPFVTAINNVAGISIYFLTTSYIYSTI